MSSSRPIAFWPNFVFGRGVVCIVTSPISPRSNLRRHIRTIFFMYMLLSTSNLLWRVQFHLWKSSKRYRSYYDDTRRKVPNKKKLENANETNRYHRKYSSDANVSFGRYIYVCSIIRNWHQLVSIRLIGWGYTESFSKGSSLRRHFFSSSIHTNAFIFVFRPSDMYTNIPDMSLHESTT